MKKIFIIIAVLFFILLAAIEIYVQSAAFAGRIRPYIAGPLKEILGPDARIGLVRANFIPPFLEVRDLVLPDARGGEAVSIRKVKVYINPVPLLLKKIRLPSISILEPRIHVVRAADGTLNITPLMERIRANLASAREGTPSRYSILLRTITVRNGEVLLKDTALSTEVSVTGLNMTARINVAGDRVSVNIRPAPLRLTAPAYPAIIGTLKFSAEYDRGRFRLGPAELTAGDAAVSVSGDIGPQPDAVLDLTGRVKSGPQTLGKLADILKPAPKQQGPRIEASVEIKGTSSDPSIDGSIKYSGLSYGGVTLTDTALSFQYRNQNLALSGENWRVVKGNKTLVIERIAAALGYRRGALDFQAAEIIAGDLTIRMQGAVDLTSGFNAHVTAESTGEGRTVSFIAPGTVEGKVKVEGSLAGALNAPVFEGTVAAGFVTVRKIQFHDVHGNVVFRDKKIILSDVDILRQSSHYGFEGSIDMSGTEPVYSARLKVIQSDVVSVVALFYAAPLPLKLSANGELSFRGTAKKYSGSGYLSLEEGSAYGESFTHGLVTASLSPGKISFPQVVVYKKKGMVKATGWIGFDGTYSADLESRDIDLAAVDLLAGMPVGGDFGLDIHSTGTFSAPAASASLDVRQLTVLQEPMGRMHADAELSGGRLTITAGLPEDRARLSFLWALRKPYAWTADAKIRTNGINPLQFLRKKDISDRVNVIAEGDVTAHGEGLDFSSLSGQAVFQRIGIVIGEYRIDNDADAVFDLKGGRISVQSLGFSGPGTKISITGSMDVSADVDIAVKGTANLPLLKLFFREVEYAAGTAEMKLTLKDEWSNPEVAGALRIQGGEIKIKDIPQKFTALSGSISFAQGRIVTDSFAGEMGGGTLAVSGWAQLSGVALQDFSVKTSVDNVTVRYPEGLTSTLSGDLYYDGNADEQTLSGDIAIRRARYDKRIEWKSMLVDVSRGLYQKKKTDIGWIGNTQINLRFHGSDNILFENNLAKMPLDVDVFMRGSVNRPQLLGRIEARKGSVYFRKNDFKILHAAVDFVDPGRMNPVLDIQAETQVREYQIRLAVTGTAERAVVTFLSDPPLIDTDILSLLALGKKGSELVGKETSVGVGEAASFATGQFQDVFERRARSLTGLDRFQVDPYIGRSDTSVPRVTVGKELIQNKLFVTYSSNVGAAIPEQSFKIEYLLDKHFSLVGERNDLGTTGGDIKYRFEFR
jgi:autotransporter translocation and assembly factor TamB